MTKAIDVVTTFHEAAAQHGYPASVLSDNGAIFTAEARHGVCVMETELLALGIAFKHSRPYHPQTCGKVERFHQTLKKHLAAHRPARSLPALQAQLDRFVDYYNTVRPHRALARRTPTIAFSARTKATPANAPLTTVPHCRIRQDKVNAGNVTLRYRTRLYHLAVGRRHEGTRVLILAANRDIRILTTSGELLRHLTLDPSRPYQPPRPTQQSMMSRDNSPRCLATSQSCRRGDHALADTHLAGVKALVRRLALSARGSRLRPLPRRSHPRRCRASTRLRHRRSSRGRGR